MGRFSKVVWLTMLVGITTACDDGEVRFGPPNGLRIRGGGTECPPLELMPTPAQCAAVTWGGTDGIFAKYMDALTPGNCAAGGCHNSPDQYGVNMVLQDADASYEALANYTDGEDGAPYVTSTPEPDKPPFMMCNIDPNAAVIVGSIMPKSPFPPYAPEALDEIRIWAACGMNKDGDLTSGAGGMGGMGVGGAGGAGGQ